MQEVTFFENEYLSPLVICENITKSPRFYQANAANSVAGYIENGYKRILVKSPTGTGKTLTSKLIALSVRMREALGKKEGETLRVLYIANKHRLNRQAEEEYAENESVELVVQSAFSDIPLETIESGWDVCFVDEAHHEAMMSIQLLLDRLTERPVIGFSADDERGDGLLLKFEAVVEAISAKEAAERGFIEKAGINSIIDTGKTDKSDLACEVLEKYHSYMGNTIIFFRTEKEVRKTTKFLRKLGCTASMLTSESTENDMDKALDRLSKGEIQFLVNCQKIGEGVDTANVTDVVLARSFNSAPEKKQYIGRAIRPDSPCAAWEFINPLVDQVAAKSVVGAVKYERLIYKQGGVFHEKLFSGEDLTWGQMSQIRVHPVVEVPFDEIEADNDEHNETMGEQSSKQTFASDKPWTLKGQGVDTNLNPSDNIIKLAIQSDLRTKNTDTLKLQKRVNGQIVTKAVEVRVKKKRSFEAGMVAA